MPQVLSKCRRPINGIVSIHINDKVKEKARISQKKDKPKWTKKGTKNGFVPIACGVQSQAPLEDWEKEIEEFSLKKEEEREEAMKYQMPYDAEDRLNMPLVEMRTYTIPSSPNLKREHYNPAAHHIPPVARTHHIYRAVKDQFADAEE